MVAYGPIEMVGTGEVQQRERILRNMVNRREVIRGRAGNGQKERYGGRKEGRKEGRKRGRKEEDRKVRWRG